MTDVEAPLDFESPVIHNLIPEEFAEFIIDDETRRLKLRRAEVLDNPEQFEGHQLLEAVMGNFFKQPQEIHHESNDA